MQTKLFSHNLRLTASALALAASLIAIPACSAGRASTVTATVTVIQSSTATSSVTGVPSNGQDIFLTGIDASGGHVTAQGFAMMTRWFSCADCHGTAGHGGTVYMMMVQYDVPNITWTELTGSNYVPPYTVDTLERAITQGLDQQGGTLNTFMPRWSMSSQDLADLASYIQTLK